jgi:integrase
MAKHLLSDRRVRTAKRQAKPYRLFDGDGLALWISPTGAKSWQLRYRLHGKEQTATLGKLGRLTLVEARVRADQLRKLAADGEHLTTVKRRDRLQRKADAASTFGVVAAGWMAREARRQKWTPAYLDEVAASLRNHLAELDALPIATLNAQTVATLLRKVEARAPMMLEKVRPRLNGILDYAVEHGLITGNPLPAIRRGRKAKRQHYPAVTKLPEIGAILRAARAADSCKGIQRAHLLLAFTALRVSEVVGAKWTEFELDGVDVLIGDTQRTRRDPAAGNWAVPRERMKRKDEERGAHVVPLPSALLAALREWREADGPGALYVCPAPRDATKPITPEGVEKFYRRALKLAGRHSPHSWRSSFSSVAREAGKDGDAIEAQLDHVVGSKIQAAYDRAQRLALRRDLMQWYERQLIAARDGAAVVAIGRQSRAHEIV